MTESKTNETLKNKTEDVDFQEVEETTNAKAEQKQFQQQIANMQQNTAIMKVHNDLLSEKVENMELTIKQSNLLERHKRAVKELEKWNNSEK